MITQAIMARIMKEIREGDFAEAGYLLQKYSALEHEEAARIVFGIRQLTWDTDALNCALDILKKQVSNLKARLEMAGRQGQWKGEEATENLEAETLAAEILDGDARHEPIVGFHVPVNAGRIRRFFGLVWRPRG